MKRTILIIIAILQILGLRSETISGQDCYYYKGQKVYLERNLMRTRVALEMTQNPTQSTHFSSEEITPVQYVIKDTVISSNIELLDKLSGNVHNDEIILPCYTSRNGENLYTTPYILVKTIDDNFDVINQIISNYKLRFVSKSKYIPNWYVLALSSETKTNPVKLSQEIYESYNIACVEPDLVSNNETKYSYDPYITEQWNLCNPDDTSYPVSLSDISIPEAWNYATGKGVNIAVIDTPIDNNHEDLKESLSNLSYDADGCKPPAVFQDRAPRELHGTNVAGIIASARNNNKGIAGVCPDAKIIPISYIPDSSSLSRYNRAQSMVWAADNGVDIISCSWAFSEPNQAVDDAIEYACEYGRGGKGCVIVFPSGNYGLDEVDYPSRSNSKVICVGSTDRDANVASTSNYGSRLDVVAPGEGVMTTFPNNSYGYNNGTSFAVPHVSGIAAMVIERNKDLTFTEIINLIKYNTKTNYRLPTSRKKRTDKEGYGLVDAYLTIKNTPK